MAMEDRLPKERSDLLLASVWVCRMARILRVQLLERPAAWSERCFPDPGCREVWWLVVQLEFAY